MREKEFSFYFIKLSLKRLFYERNLAENLYNRNFADFAMKHGVFSVQIRVVQKPIWLANDFSQCIIALLSFLPLFLD